MSKRVLAVAAIAALTSVPTAIAAGGPPPPKAASGATVNVLAQGVATPTAFAFLGDVTFVAGFGDEQHPKITGGVYLVKGGKATKLPGSPAHVMGLVTSGKTLYLSTISQSAPSTILAWSGWNGTKFATSKVVATGPKGFSGFNGLAVKGGTLYSGVSLGDSKKADFEKGTGPYANSVVSVDIATGKITPVSTGYRQPWQLTYVPGHAYPIVSDLGQENLKKGHPPDFLKEAKPGTNYGFPACPAKPATCSKYAKPFASFPAHSSPMGLGVLGGKLYVALFGGTGKGPEVVSMSTKGGAFTPALTGFKAPVVALATHGGMVYTGDLTGAVYSFKG
jgi:glucose/arabinose dehydrogenase